MWDPMQVWGACGYGELTGAQFHGSAYRKHRIGTYGSREFCAYGKPISRVSSEFWLLRMRSQRMWDPLPLKKMANMSIQTGQSNW